jgi:hypothetical protein
MHGLKRRGLQSEHRAARQCSTVLIQGRVAEVGRYDVFKVFMPDVHLAADC